MIRVYFRNFDSSLGLCKVDTNDFEEAQIAVFESFIEANIEPPKPLMAVVK